MGIKKNFFAPLALGLGATRRAAMLLLVMMLTTATAWATDKTLSGSESYTAQDGDVLTGSTSGTVTIAADAKITLSDVTITGGIVCAGTAEITLVGTNSVTGFSEYDSNINAYRYTAGIQVGGSGTTLTIKGDGSLTANGALHSAGIGLSRAWDVDANGGHIVIEGGNITATGNGMGAGIGTGVCYGKGTDNTATIGNITIKGGTVRAIGGTDNGYPGNGIGKGGAYNSGHAVVGTITIYDGIDMVDASSISESIVYMHGETNVTANKSDYFTIIENGNRRVIAPKDDTDYTITIADGIEHGTIACEATTAKLGANVTITATPDQGYIFSRLVVKDAQNNDVTSTGNSFIMPKSNVTVSADFAEDPYNGTCGNGVYYAYDSSTKTLTISGTGAMWDYDDPSECPWNSYAEQINEVVIGNDVTSIGVGAFSGCYYLESVTVYAPSCSLGEDAFANCDKLTKIYVFSDLVDDYKAAENWSDYKGKITEMPNPNGKCGDNVRWALTGESTNYTLTICGDGNMDYNDLPERPWNSYAGGIRAVVIESGVESISNNAFQGCSNLATVSFAPCSTLKTIGDGAFQGCSNLTSITIPASVTSIGSDVFMGCNNLASITVEAGNTVYDSRNGCNAIIEKSTNTLIIGCKNSTIPAGVTSIGESAFYATDLTSIEIPAGVTSIGAWAFCVTGLTSIEIPASVTSIGERAFQNCRNLATVTVYAPSCTLGDKAFLNCSKLENIYVFSDLVDDYQGAENWSDYKGKITALPTVTTSYVDADGTLHEGVEAVPLNNAMTTLPTGTYVVNSDVAYTGTVTLSGNVTLILGDDCTMSFGKQNEPLNAKIIECNSHNLTIYGQSGGTGWLKAYSDTGSGIDAVYDYQQYSGNVVIFEFNGACINADNSVTLLGGTLDVKSGGGGQGDIFAQWDINILGGKLWARESGLKTMNGKIILGYTKPTDEIYAYSYQPQDGLQIADGQTLVDSYGYIWSGTLVQKNEINDRTLKPLVYSGVTLTGNGLNASAAFDGTSTTTLSIPVDVKVNSVTYNRTFTAGKPATVMLPFDYTCTGSEGGTFYKFVGVEKEGNTWVATMKSTGDDTNNQGTLTANTPYLFMPTGASLTFTGGVTLNTKGGGGKETADEGSHWTFKGTYEYMKWTTETGDPDYNAEREAEIGRAYGFAGVAKTGINVGDFVRVASGAKIRPMGCYLLWNNEPNSANARSFTRGAAATEEELPQRITVRLVGSNGETTAIGTIDNGQLIIDNYADADGWYDLQGRKLSDKPTKKGLYINNGRKIVIK